MKFQFMLDQQAQYFRCPTLDLEVHENTRKVHIATVPSSAEGFSPTAFESLSSEERCFWAGDEG